MTKDEALRKAIEQIKWADHLHDWHDGLLDALQACKEALAQPTAEQSSLVQEPVAYYKEWEDTSGKHKDIKFSISEGYKPLYTTPPKAETQEPVVYVCIDFDVKEISNIISVEF